MYENFTADIILNDVRMNEFPLRTEAKQVCLLSSLVLIIVLVVFPVAKRQEEFKGICAGGKGI